MLNFEVQDKDIVLYRYRLQNEGSWFNNQGNMLLARLKNKFVIINGVRFPIDPDGYKKMCDAIKVYEDHLLILEDFEGQILGALSFCDTPLVGKLRIEHIGVLSRHKKFGYRLFKAAALIALINKLGLTLEAENDDSMKFFHERIGMRRVDQFTCEFSLKETRVFLNQ